MKKLGKIGYISIGSLFTMILTFSILTFAEQPSTVSTNEFAGNPTLIDKDHNEITLFDGTKKSNFTLNSDTIIYRDNQQTTLDQLQYTDDVKVTLNSEQVVRYVVATPTKKQEQPTVQAAASAAPAPTSAQPPSVSTKTAQPSQPALSIREFELNIDLDRGRKFDIHFNTDKKGKADSRVHNKLEKQNIEMKDEQATAFIQSLIKQLALQPNMSETDIANKVQAILGIQPNTYKKFELKAKFSNDQEIHVHLDSKEHGKNNP